MPKNPKPKNKSNLSLAGKILVVLMLLVGLYLRLEPVFFGITHFSFDQGLDQILVKQLVEDKNISLISRYTGLEGVFMGPWYTWFLAPPYLFSGGHPSANVVYLSFVGIASIILSFFLVRKMTNALVPAAIFAYLLLLSPEHVSASTIILNPNSLHFLVIPYLYFVYQIIKKESYSNLVYLALIISLCFQLEIGFAIFALMSAGLVILYYKKIAPLKTKWFLLSIIVFIIPFIPQIIFDLRHNHIISNSIHKYFTGENTSLGGSLPLISRIPDRIKMLSADFASAVGFRINNPIAVWVSLSVIAYGFWLNIKYKIKENQYLAKITALTIVLFYLGFLIYPGTVWGWYRAGIPTLMLLLSALSLSAYYQTGKFHKKILFTYLIFMFFVGFHIHDRVEVASGNYHDNVSTLRAQQVVIDSVYQDAAGEPFALYVYTPPVYTYIWDYQLHWYARSKYGYLPKPYDIRPQAGNPKLIYLIREPDDNNERVHGWIGNFKANGKSVDVWHTTAGITIEKWEFEREPSVSYPIIKFVDALSTE